MALLLSQQANFVTWEMQSRVALSLLINVQNPGKQGGGKTIDCVQ